MEKRGDALFEASWEVCNKVGGIFTVVSSKAAQMQRVYGDGYYLLGPYFQDKLAGQFSEEPLPDHLKKVFDEVEKQGIVCHYGRWMIEGEPQVILLDTTHYWHVLNEIKGKLWEWNQVDSLHAGHDYDEPVLWSFVSGMFIHAFEHHHSEKKILAQFHEWLSGAGLLYLRQAQSDVRTVFTTHATTLGRALANAQVDLYGLLDTIDADKASYEHHCQSKHLLEKASAQQAHIFTTVSEITGMEAQHFLGRKPEVLLPNGLDIEKFPPVEDILAQHALQRDRIRDFLASYFFPYYCFDLDHTLCYFLAARYEYRAKGIDLYLQALQKLNAKLQAEKSKRTVVAFVFVPANVKQVKPEILEGKMKFQDVKDSLAEQRHGMEQRMLRTFLQKGRITKDALFDKHFLRAMQKKVAKFNKEGLPPVVTHDLFDQDIILQRVHDLGLDNKEENPVKVIFYPIYLAGADGLLDLDYYESMQGCHLGVFPSYYEPWGYTPVEAGALGVASVTTDLSGFGRYFCQDGKQTDFPGIHVLQRLGKEDAAVEDKLFSVMHEYSKLTKDQRTKNKLEARKIAGSVDWKHFVQYYVEAHNKALEQ